MHITPQVKENIKALDDLMNKSQSQIDIALSAQTAINKQILDQYDKFGYREMLLPKWLGGNTPARQRLDELNKREADYKKILETETGLLQATNRQVKSVITDYLESTGDIVYKVLDDLLRDLEPALNATSHYLTFVQSAVNERNAAKFEFVEGSDLDTALNYFKLQGYSMPAEAVQQSTRKLVLELNNYEFSLDEHTSSANYLAFDKTVDFNLNYLAREDYEILSLKSQALKRHAASDTVVLQENIGKVHEDTLEIKSILNKHYLSAMGNMTAYVAKALEEARK